MSGTARRVPAGINLSQLAARPSVRFAPGRLVPAALTVLATPVLARLLGASDYGVLALLTTGGTVAATLVFGWAEIVAVRNLVDADLDPTSFLSSLGAPMLLGAAAITGLSFLVGVATGQIVLILLTAGMTIFFGLALMLSGAARARDDALAYAGNLTLAASGRYLFGVPLVALGFGVGGVMFGWLVGSVIATGIGAVRLGVRMNDLGVRWPDPATVRFAAPAAAVTFGLVTLQLSDRLILGLFQPSNIVGVYALAYALIEQTMVLVFSLLLTARYTQLMAVYDREGPVQAAEALRLALLRFLPVAVGLCLVLSLFGAHAVELIGGSEFSSASLGFMPFVGIGVTLFGGAQYASIPMQQARATGQWATGVLAAAAIHVVVCFALTPWLGLWGVAVSTLAGYLAMLTVNYRQSRTLVPRYIYASDLAAPLTAAAVAFGVGASLRDGGTWPLSLVLVALSYVACFAALRRVISG